MNQCCVWLTLPDGAPAVWTTSEGFPETCELRPSCIIAPGTKMAPMRAQRRTASSRGQEEEPLERGVERTSDPGQAFQGRFWNAFHNKGLYHILSNTALSKMYNFSRIWESYPTELWQLVPLPDPPNSFSWLESHYGDQVVLKFT